MGMEIIVSDNALNGIVNFDELMSEVREQLEPYRGLIVAEDGIGKAKTVVANMRKAGKAASDTRIRIEKEHKAKIEKTLNQLKELTGAYTDAADEIDGQVKAIMNERKKEKRDRLRGKWAELVAEKEIGFVNFERIEDPKWMNATVGEDAACEQMEEMAARFESDLEAVKALTEDSYLRNALITMFKVKLDLNEVIRYKALMEQEAKKMEAVEKKAEPVKVEEEPEQEKEPEKDEDVEIVFKVKAPMWKIQMLKKFLVENEITYGKA